MSVIELYIFVKNARFIDSEQIKGMMTYNANDMYVFSNPSYLYLD